MAAVRVPSSCEAHFRLLLLFQNSSPCKSTTSGSASVARVSQGGTFSFRTGVINCGNSPSLTSSSPTGKSCFGASLRIRSGSSCWKSSVSQPLGMSWWKGRSRRTAWPRGQFESWMATGKSPLVSFFSPGMKIFSTIIKREKAQTLSPLYPSSIFPGNRQGDRELWIRKSAITSLLFAEPYHPPFRTACACPCGWSRAVMPVLSWPDLPSAPSGDRNFLHNSFNVLASLLDFQRTICCPIF